MAETNGTEWNRPAETAARPAETAAATAATATANWHAVMADAKAVQARAVEELKETVKAPEKTDVWKSIFRVKHDETPRSRALGVLSNVFLHLHPAKINRDAVAYNYTWGMGGITFYLFIVLMFTGHAADVLLPPVEGGRRSATSCTWSIDVPFGKLLRNMHRWAAHLMVITVGLHMFRVFLTGSYKTPREFNWIVGVLLLVLTLLLTFTGYLLPDDQLGFWAVTVGTNMARATPLLGHDGPFGPQLGHDGRSTTCASRCWADRSSTRTRCCAPTSGTASRFRSSPRLFMIVHFWRVRKDGGISGPAPVMLESEIKEPEEGLAREHHGLHQLWTILEHAGQRADRADAVPGARSTPGTGSGRRSRTTG